MHARTHARTHAHTHTHTLLQEAVDRVTDKLQSLPKTDNLVPLFINAETGQLRRGTLTLGARADTYYEYLLKQWLQSGRRERR